MRHKKFLSSKRNRNKLISISTSSSRTDLSEFQQVSLLTEKASRIQDSSYSSGYKVTKITSVITLDYLIQRFPESLLL